MSIFSSIQDYQNGLVSRFCNPKRLLIAETDWYREESDIDVIKGDCCERILFFEKRNLPFLLSSPIDDDGLYDFHFFLEH